MKTKMKWVMVAGLALAAGVASAQTYLAMTNTLFYTNRWTSAVARVQQSPSTTNDPWVIQFQLQGAIAPGWALTTNNATVNYGANAFASVAVTNSEIATLNGQNITNVLNMPYFAASTNAMAAAMQKLIQSTIGR